MGESSPSGSNCHRPLNAGRRRDTTADLDPETCLFRAA